MKKRVAHFWELIRVIANCIRIFFQSSHKYFILRVAFACIGIAAPFLSIHLSREIENALVEEFFQNKNDVFYLSFFAVFLILAETLQRRGGPSSQLGPCPKGLACLIVTSQFDTA